MLLLPNDSHAAVLAEMTVAHIDAIAAGNQELSTRETNLLPSLPFPSSLCSFPPVWSVTPQNGEGSCGEVTPLQTRQRETLFYQCRGVMDWGKGRGMMEGGREGGREGEAGRE